MEEINSSSVNEERSIGGMAAKEYNRSSEGKKSRLSVDTAVDDLAGDYPKQYVVVIDRHPEDPARIVVHRSVTNMSAFELYGLLVMLTRAVEAQCQFPLNQRSDGIDVVDRRSGPLPDPPEVKD